MGNALNYRLHGRAPYKAVAIHGGPGAPGSAFALAKGTGEIIGTIEPFQTEFSIHGQVEELAAQIECITNEPVFALGHSWGAWLVLLLAYKYPMLVQKGFLIGSGVLNQRYVNEISKRRLAMLSEEEAKEYHLTLETIESGTTTNLDGLLRKLQELTEKSDNYCIEQIAPDEKEILPSNANQYKSVWSEGAKLRSEGYFEKIALQISTPVRVIHGAQDPSPIKGVVEPLKGKITDLKWYELPRCGHYPWREKHAQNMFWEIIRTELK